MTSPAVTAVSGDSSAAAANHPLTELEAECARRAADLTVPALLERNALEFGDLPAISVIGSEDAPLTWATVRTRSLALARGLYELGLRPGERMLIAMSSRPEHWLVDLGAVHLGAIPSTVYATLSTPQLQYAAEHSQAQVLILEGAEQLERWAPVLAGQTSIHSVVIVDADALPAGPLSADEARLRPRFHTLAEVERDGAARHIADPGVVDRLWRAVRPHQPVALLYTSGTTGTPKGVVLSHHNVLYQSVALEAQVDLPAHPVTVAYLPLAHIAERVLGIYAPIYRAGHVHICADTAAVVSALAAIHPLSFFGVPRVWEKLAAGLQTMIALADDERRGALAAAQAVALEVHNLTEAHAPVPEELARHFDDAQLSVLRPLLGTLGLDRMIWACSGAAPIPAAVLRTLAGLGIEVREVWGLSETTGTATINTLDVFRTGTVGRPHLGMRLRLADDGEILIRGPLVCLGYLRADGTIETITDADGWLATGDIGTLDDAGYLTITDRKKELIITSTGKNVAPAQIENLLRAHPLIGQAVAIGDRRPYVTALLVLDDEVAPAWAKAAGLDADAPDASGASGASARLAAHPAVLAELQGAVDAANSRLARAEQVKKFRVLPVGWTPESGELTPTLKLRRRIINEKYATEIDDLYS
ncbi:long-chain acyl-CoA synthetase [Parafrankia irregularis]|uniref:Acyl-CoA synthetase n=1 Tax=Parafrankia irregularis TaxID=795642 RepID=A0A0S4QR08_9ACTN|nr:MULTISPECIES: AMP-dependent synthetase/ligase [Parafrankia]CUU58039.1 long-chain acyl-CoA synthetase [Parafrankia irregularis]